jgi:hypothetical protein
MWQRSCFYDKALFAKKGWHLRWFTLEATKMSSVPNRIHFEKHKIKYPIFESIEVDEKRLMIRVANPIPEKRDFILLCPSRDIFEQVVVKMGAMIERNKEDKKELSGEISQEDAVVDHGAFEDRMESLVLFPADGGNVEIISFILLYPFRFLMHITVPDVRTMDENGMPKSTLSNASIAILMCLVWLIIGSYAMVASLEALAALMDIPDAVVVSNRCWFLRRPHAPYPSFFFSHNFNRE